VVFLKYLRFFEIATLENFDISNV